MEATILMSICKLRDCSSENDCGVPTNGYSVFSFCANTQNVCFKYKNTYAQSVQYMVQTHAYLSVCSRLL